MNSRPTRWSATKKVGVGIAAGLTFIGVVVALLNDSVSLHDRFADGPTTSAASSATPSPLSPTREQPKRGSASPSPSGASRAPVCEDASEAPTDCQLPHQFEFYDGACDTDALITWFGGRPDVDVPRASVREVSTGHCEVDLKTSVAGIAKNGFDRDDSSIFRKCVDEKSQSVVACDTRHTAEYVGAAVDGIATRTQCRDAAGAYLGVSVSQRSNELAVRAIAATPVGGANARCMIEVIGAQRLDRTVRGIGTSQLHWVP